MTNEEHDFESLESELKELRPQRVSGSLRSKVGEAVEREASVATAEVDVEKTLQRPLLWVAAAVGTAAVVLIVASVWVANYGRPGKEKIVKPDGDVPIQDSEGDVPIPDVAPDAPGDPPRPTMLTYTLAMNSSDTDFEEMLDFHAESLLSQTSEGNLSWSDAARRFGLQEEN